MTRILESVSSNCKYTLCSARFRAAVAGYLAMLIFATADYYQPGANVWYLLRLSRAFGSYYFSLVICALPGAAKFAEEWCSERFIFSYLRTGKKEYAVSVILSSFLCAFLVAFIGTSMYIGIYSLINPITSDITDVFFEQQMSGYTNGGLLYNGHIFAYYSLDVLNTSCFMGLFSALATMFSVVITNAYITIIMPLVLYEITSVLCNILSAPLLSHPHYVFGSGNTVIRLLYPSREITAENNFTVISMLYPLIYLAVCLAIITIVSHFLIKRKYENNSDIRGI